MDFKEYQLLAQMTRIYPEDMQIVYPCLGLSGEVGEVCDKIKKIYRDKEGIFSKEDKEAIKKEMGDVLWYLASLAADLHTNLDCIAEQNINKILNRKENGKISGEGDNR